MGWRVKIKHLTRVEYDGEAVSSYNEIRMTPLDDRAQNTLERRLIIRPSTPIWTYTDYWGTLVSVFDLPKPHRSLMIESLSRVETSGPRPLAKPLSWEELRAADGPVAEMLLPTTMTTVSPELAEIAAGEVPGRDPHEAAEAVARLVNERVAYVPGSTGVLTDAQEAWDQGSGVCQDMAHLTVALLRAAGLPARYVSGYLHPQREAAVGEPVVGQSHAWIEYWAGEWAALDPTNRVPVGSGHIVVARGRDYTDVPPLKGIYQGPPAQTQEVRVEITRLA